MLERPLPFKRRFDEGDDASMIVEVASTIGENDLTINESNFHTPAETPNKNPPMRVMHRSYCGDEVRVSVCVL